MDSLVSVLTHSVHDISNARRAIKTAIMWAGPWAASAAYEYILQKQLLFTLSKHAVRYNSMHLARISLARSSQYNIMPEN